MSAVAEEVEEEVEVEEEATTRRTRSKLSEDNVYFFAPDQKAAGEAAKILKEDGTKVANYRLYTVSSGKKGVVGYCQGMNALDATSRYAQHQGVVAEVTNPKKRGGGTGTRGQKVDPIIASAMQALVATDPASVKNFLADDKNTRYREVIKM